MGKSLKFKNHFFRNVITLSFGTFISQVLVLLTAPLLSRLYQVNSFGELAFFTSITSFFAVISTGRYELAIGLPKKDQEAKVIIKSIGLIATIICLIYLLFIFFLRDILFINKVTIFLVPPYIFIVAICSAFSYWKQRKKKYKQISVSILLQVFFTTLISIFLGYFFNVNDGMIYSLVLGHAISLGYHIYTDREIFLSVLNQKKYKETMIKYIAFPKYMLFSDLSMVAGQQFLPIIFSFLYNSTVVGFFSMANRIIRIPIIFITSPISNVFRNEAIETIREKGQCKELFISLFKRLFIFSLGIYLILFFIAPYFFSFFLGKQWVVAGDYARVISFFLFLEFISSPLVSIFNVRGKQKLLMKIQLASTLSGFIFLFLSDYFFSSPYISLIFFSINAFFFNSVLIIFSYNISKIESHSL